MSQSMNDQKSTPSCSPSDPVASLVRLGGPRTPVPEDAIRRSRVAARQAWSEVVQTRKRRRRFQWAVAASLFLVVSAVILGSSSGLGSDLVSRLFGPSPTVATVEIVAGSGLQGLTSSPDETPRSLKAGETIETVDGMASLRLAGGSSLRLHAQTRLRLITEHELALERGAIYLDAGPDDVQLSIQTPFGLVRDIGTQFEVRLDDQDLRIRVREGEVELTKGRRRSAVKRGDELTVQKNGEAQRRRVAVHGEPWRPYQAVAPALNLEGATLASYLHWLSRETGWTLRYRQSDIRSQAPTVILHGSIDGVPVVETPEIVLPTCQLEAELRDGVLEIRRLNEEAL